MPKTMEVETILEKRGITIVKRAGMRGISPLWSFEETRGWRDHEAAPFPIRAVSLIADEGRRFENKRILVVRASRAQARAPQFGPLD
jgi:hypothetical protein